MPGATASLNADGPGPATSTEAADFKSLGLQEPAPTPTKPQPNVDPAFQVAPYSNLPAPPDTTQLLPEWEQLTADPRWQTLNADQKSQIVDQYANEVNARAREAGEKPEDIAAKSNTWRQARANDIQNPKGTAQSIAGLAPAGFLSSVAGAVSGAGVNAGDLEDPRAAADRKVLNQVPLNYLQSELSNVQEMQKNPRKAYQDYIKENPEAAANPSNRLAHDYDYFQNDLTRRAGDLQQAIAGHPVQDIRTAGDAVAKWGSDMQQGIENDIDPKVRNSMAGKFVMNAAGMIPYMLTEAIPGVGQGITAAMMQAQSRGDIYQSEKAQIANNPKFANLTSDQQDELARQNSLLVSLPSAILATKGISMLNAGIPARNIPAQLMKDAFGFGLISGGSQGIKEAVDASSGTGEPGNNPWGNILGETVSGVGQGLILGAGGALVGTIARKRAEVQAVKDTHVAVSQLADQMATDHPDVFRDSDHAYDTLIQPFPEATKKSLLDVRAKEQEADAHDKAAGELDKANSPQTAAVERQLADKARNTPPTAPSDLADIFDKDVKDQNEPEPVPTAPSVKPEESTKTLTDFIHAKDETGLAKAVSEGLPVTAEEFEQHAPELRGKYDFNGNELVPIEKNAETEPAPQETGPAQAPEKKTFADFAKENDAAGLQAALDSGQQIPITHADRGQYQDFADQNGFDAKWNRGQGAGIVIPITDRVTLQSQKPEFLDRAKQWERLTPERETQIGPGIRTIADLQAAADAKLSGYSGHRLTGDDVVSDATLRFLDQVHKGKLPEDASPSTVTAFAKRTFNTSIQDALRELEKLKAKGVVSDVSLDRPMTEGGDTLHEVVGDQSQTPQMEHDTVAQQFEHEPQAASDHGDVSNLVDQFRATLSPEDRIAFNAALDDKHLGVFSGEPLNESNTTATDRDRVFESFRDFARGRLTHSEPRPTPSESAERTGDTGATEAGRGTAGAGETGRGTEDVQHDNGRNKPSGERGSEHPDAALSEASSARPASAVEHPATGESANSNGQGARGTEPGRSGLESANGSTAERGPNYPASPDRVNVGGAPDTRTGLMEKLNSGEITPQEYKARWKVLQSPPVADPRPGWTEVEGSPKDPVAERLHTGNAADALTALQEHGDDSVKEALPRLEAQRDRLNQVGIHIIDSPETGGFYHDGKIFLTKGQLDANNLHQVLAHEMAHAVSHAVLSDPRGPHEEELVRRFDRIRQEVLGALPPEMRDSFYQKVQPLIEARRASGDSRIDYNRLTEDEKKWMPVLYALSDPHEAAAQLFSSPEFRSFAKSVRYYGDSWFERLSNWVGDLLGFDTKSTALDHFWSTADQINDAAARRPGVPIDSNPLHSAPSSNRGRSFEGMLHDAGFRMEPAVRLGDQVTTGKDHWDAAQAFAQIHEGSSLRQSGQGIHIRVPSEATEGMPATGLKSTMLEQGYRTGDGRFITRDQAAQLLRDSRPYLSAPDVERKPITGEVRLARKLSKYNVAQGTSAILDAIAEKTKNPTYGAVAKFLKASLESSPEVKINVERMKNGELGMYHLTNDKIRINQDLNDDQTERAILHELAHAVSAGKINAYMLDRMDQLSPAERSAIQDLGALRQKALSHPSTPDEIRALAAADPATRNLIFSALDDKFNKYYGLINLPEFVSEALTNGDFQRHLSGMKDISGPKPKGLMTKVWDAVSRLFGGKEDSVLSKTLERIGTVTEGGRRLMGAGVEVDGLQGYKNRMMEDDRSEIDRRVADIHPDTEELPRQNLPHDWNDVKSNPEPSFESQYNPRAFEGLKSGADVLDRIAQAKGLEHRDIEALRSEADKAFNQNAITPHQYAEAWRALDSTSFPLLGALGGNKEDRNSWTRRFGRWMKDWTSEGNLPRVTEDTGYRSSPAYEATQEIQAKRDAAAQIVRDRLTDLDRAVRQDYKGSPLDKLPTAKLEQFTQILQGRAAPADFPVNTYRAIRAMRDSIDYLSRKAQVYLPPDLAAKFADNEGFYTKRSYRIFDDPRWIERNVTEAKKDQAARDLVEKFRSDKARDAGIQAQAQWLKVNPGQFGTLEHRAVFKEAFDKAKTEAEKTVQYSSMRRFVDRQMSDFRDIAEGKGNSNFGRPAAKTDTTFFKERQDLPESYRTLLGENTDPRAVFAQSMQKLSDFLATSQGLRDIRSAGEGQWLFKEPNGIHDAKIAKEDNRAYDPLDGMYTTPEIREALKAARAVSTGNNPTMNLLMKMNRVAKTVHTIDSVRSAMRNYTTQGFNLLMNGHGLSPDAVKKAVGTLATDWGKLDDPGLRAQLLRYRGLGLLDQDPNVRTLREISKAWNKNSGQPIDLQDAISGQFANNPVFKVLRKTQNFAEHFYATADSMGKILNFEMERSMLAKAFPDIAQNSPTELDSMASKRTRDTMPTWSRMSPNVRAVVNQPFFGPFAGYFAEATRAATNSAYYAFKDLKEGVRQGNGVLTSSGIRRIAGIGAALTGPALIGWATARAVGMSDKDVDNFRKLLPWWEQNSALLFFKHENGKIGYANLNYSSPYSYFTDAVTQIGRSMSGHEDVPTMVGKTMGQLMRNFSDAGIIVPRIYQALGNKNDFGQSIVNENLPGTEQFMGRLGYAFDPIWEGGTPGRVIRSWIPTAMGKTTSSGGMATTLPEHIGGELVGGKIAEVDLGQRLRSSLNDEMDDLHKVEQIFTSPFQNPGHPMDSDEIKQTYAKMEAARYHAFMDIHEKVQAALQSGVAPAIVHQALSKYDKEAGPLMVGRYVPYRPTKNLLHNAQVAGKTLPPGTVSTQTRSLNE
jgi:hypothetical protein